MPPASPLPRRASRRAPRRTAAALGLALSIAACARATPPGAPAPAPERYPLLPQPTRLDARAGEFRLDGATRIVLPDPASADLRPLAELFAAPLRAASGLPIPVDPTPSIGDDAPDAITLRLTAASDAPDAAGREHYHLRVTTRGATITAPTPAGLFDGLQTLRQLLPPAYERSVRALSPWDASGGLAAAAALPASAPPASWSIPAVEIDDAPRFGYRGVMLDVARHFEPPEFVEHLVDVLALYKLNTLHLHLTDDQGWRLEIRKYPRLTQVGAWRKETIVGKHFDPYVGDATPYGGFYTQQQVRDLVAYAAARHVTIVPEIEMPGHALAALAAYPELACTPGPFEPWTRWGVSEDVFCPSEATFAFLEDVLTEVMQLFPSDYVHVGGDEVPKARWKASPVAQEVMRREGLASEEELQSWFTRRIERFLRDHGRKLIGWDEILEGGIAPEATVMSWRGTAGGIAAARQGHDVVMAPNRYVYLDYYQGDPAAEPLAIGGFDPLDTVYAWDPVPAALTPGEATHVLGAQANLWTEYVATPSHAEYMLFPRLLALAEVVWSPKAARDRARFMARLPAQFARLDALGANYRVPEPEGLAGDVKVIEGRTRVTIAPPFPGAVVRYTTDGREPDSTSPRYTGPLTVHVGATPTTVKARTFLPNGRASVVAGERIARATWRQATTTVRAAALTPGLAYGYREGTFAAADDVRQTAAFDRTGTVPRVERRGDERPEKYGLRLTGLVRVPKDALYTFYLRCDDGARLRVDDDVVVDNDGEHGATEERGQAALRAGLHRFELDYFQAGGGAALQLDVSAPNLPRRPVPAEWLVHE